MEGRKFFLALAVCAVIVFIHTWYGNYRWPKKQEEERPTAASEGVEGSEGQTPTPGGSEEPLAQNGEEEKPPEITSAGGWESLTGQLAVGSGLPVETITLGSRTGGSGYWIELLLTTDGGAISKAWLTEFAGDSDEYKYSESPYGQGRRTPVMLLSPVPGRAKSEKALKDEPPVRYSLATSRLRFKLNSGGNDADEKVLGVVDLMELSAEAESTKWKVLKNSPGEAKFETVIELLDNGKSLGTVTLVKTYR